MFKVVVISSGSLSVIGKLVRRIHAEVPDARVCGVLLERRSGKTLSKRLTNFTKNLRQTEFLAYAGSRLMSGARTTFGNFGSTLLRLAHGGRPGPYKDEPFDTPLLVTKDCHSAEALDFVRGLNADLGVVYGARILKPCLFSIPRLGSINIHKRKVPDYRGGGPVGLWEMLDGQPVIGVTVHEVEEKLDSGAVINQGTIAIEPFDTLSSLAMKAHVMANDLLVRSIADYARSTVKRATQCGESRMFKNPTPQQLARYEKQLSAQRPGFEPKRGRSKANLLIRTAVAGPLITARNWRCRLGRQFPLTILFHHLIADRPHGLGMSTAHFLRHVEFLRRHYRILSMRDALELLRTRSVSKPAVVLTFDDGYRDNFLTLRAIREKIEVPMTLFISTAIVEGQARFPHDVKHRNSDFKAFTWEQLRILQREGFEIGSHTRTHFDCGSRDPERLRAEIVGSKRDLEEHLGIAVELFSFPYGLPGNISPEAMTIATANYKHVFSAYGGNNFAGQSEGLKHLKRWAHPNDLWELELMIQGVLDSEPREAREPSVFSTPVLGES
jgi:peptidoglycan/xylan/chitin deacetylase (PgdA/CDA1 family)/folate-dependent phosphoribosylglycinamide formyltransferase PurN